MGVRGMDGKGKGKGKPETTLGFSAGELTNYCILSTSTWIISGANCTDGLRGGS